MKSNYINDFISELGNEFSIYNSPIEAQDKIEELGKKLKKQIRGLSEIQRELIVQTIIKAVLFTDPVANVQTVFGDYLQLSLKKVGLDERWEVVNRLSKAIVLIDSVAFLDALTSSTPLSKMKLHRRGEDLDKLVSWLMQDPKLLCKAIDRYTNFQLISKKPNYHFVPNYFGASFHKQRPINEVPIFGDIAGKCIESGASLLNYDRLFTLYNILYRLSQGKSQYFGIIEVGVFRGGTSLFIALIIEALGLADCTLHACDTFTGHPSPDLISGIDRYSEAHFTQTSADSVKTLLAPFPFATVHIGRIQDTFQELPDRIGLIHLDTDLYTPTQYVLNNYFDRLIQNGAIVVDDYDTKGCPGIKKAVDEFMISRPDAFGIPMLTAQYVIVKSKDES